MRHRVDHRKLGRTSAHREALLRNLTIALFDKEKITTTVPKAKELRRFAEKLVTLSKRETLHARRLCLSRLQDRDVVAKLFDTLSARYAKRPGGYTRIIHLGPRRGDAADMAVIELVDSEVASAAGKAKAAEGKADKAGKAAPAEAAAGGEAGADETKAKGKPKGKAEGKAKAKSGTAKASKRRSAAAEEQPAGKRAGRAEAARKGPAKATRARTAGRKSGSGGKSD